MSAETLIAAVGDGNLNTAEAVRDALTGVLGRADQLSQDIALGRAYTFSDSPNASYAEENFALNGASHKYILTSPHENYGPSTSYANGALGWRDSDIAADLTIKIDFGADEAWVHESHVEGHWNTGQQIYHPSAVKLEYSDNDSDYTVFDQAYTSQSDNPGTLAISEWWYRFTDTPVTARYWRWTLASPSPGGGDNWLFLRRVRLLGRIA